MLSPLAPVPMPPAIRWREFRLRVLPWCVFVLAVLAAAEIWDRAVAPPTLLAEAELIQSDVRALQAGTLAGLELQPLQPVKAGQTIGQLIQSDPQVLAASLGVINAEVELLSASLEPVMGAQRVALERQRLQLEWMHERVALASLRAQLADAETNLARLAQLRAGSLVTDEAFTTATILRDGLAAQVAEQALLVETFAPTMPVTDGRVGPTAPASAEHTLAAALRVQEQKLRLAEAQLGAVALRAPIDGVITVIHHRSGETVPAGEPVVTIAATKPARLIGYLRQPLAFEPRVGQAVEVRTRVLPRRVGVATIEEIGSALEPVSPTLLAAINRTGAVELGLRVHIRVPAEMALHPGECVDVVLRDRNS